MPHQTPDNPANLADTGCPVAAAVELGRRIKQGRRELVELGRQRRRALQRARDAGVRVTDLAADLGLTKGRISQLTPRKAAA